MSKRNFSSYLKKVKNQQVCSVEFTRGYAALKSTDTSVEVVEKT